MVLGISRESIELQLTKCLKFWYNELNNKKSVDIIYIGEGRG